MRLPADIIKPYIRQSNSRCKTVKPGMQFRDIYRLLNQKKDVCLEGTYGFAMSFYSWLKKQLLQRYPVNDYLSSRRYRGKLIEYQSHIWTTIRNHRSTLKKAPENQWLQGFFAGKDEFIMTFSDFLGMNGAWQWYESGVQYPVIGHLIHPFYGTYFPSRYDHLLLFDRWLSENKKFRNAVDIGTGCGILTLILHKHGIKNIHATDINPNAIYSVKQELRRLGKRTFENVTLEQADLSGSYVIEADDLVVFNPPWVPGDAEKTMDLATYYEQGFFERFFIAMASKCPPGATVLLLFSDFAICAGLTDRHPIREMLNKYDDAFQLLNYHREKVKQPPAKRKNWLEAIREKEETELFVIRKI